MEQEATETTENWFSACSFSSVAEMIDLRLIADDSTFENVRPIHEASLLSHTKLYAILLVVVIDSMIAKPTDKMSGLILPSVQHEDH